MRTCKVIELGLIRYDEALALQQRLVSARKSGAAPDVLLLSEDPHVITQHVASETSPTLGKDGTSHMRHMIAPTSVLGT